MTTAEFLRKDGLIVSFLVKGHSTSDESDQNGKLICSAVSSAVIMAANTITDIIGADADVSVDDAELSLKLKSKFSESQDVLNGLLLHLKELQKQYRKHLKVYSEV